LSAKETKMLRLTRIEEGACYVSDTARLYVAWSMLCSSSKLFWGCGMIENLDRVKSLCQAIGDEPAATSELFELLQTIESTVLDAVRIAICFENYFKAKLLLDDYVIHQMDLDVCRQFYPQFVKNTGKVLLQKTSPILIVEIKQAEKQDCYSIEPLQTLTKQTITMGILLGQPKYRAVFSRDQAPDDQKLFSVLLKLNDTRNTLHFLNIEYVAGGMAIDDFVFLRDYVSSHIDALANKIGDEDKWKIDIGKHEVLNLLPETEYNDAG
jgi:hypothetical protein